MMKKLLIFSLLLVSSTAWACDSYEDCTEKLKIFEESNKEDLSITWTSPPYKNSTAIVADLRSQAIAFKLDEISKKLDKQENKPMDKS